MPDKRTSIRNAKQYEALKSKGMSKERAARIANSRGAPSRRAGRRDPPRPESIARTAGAGSVTPSPYGWPVIDRTRADRGGP